MRDKTNKTKKGQTLMNTMKKEKVKISKEDNDGKNETTNLDFTSGLLSFT